jgi:phosphorylase kinase alpha/beta subunit
MNENKIDSLLEKHYLSIEKIILSRQNPITGLLPASTSINAHGDYTDAWVRDNVYSILAVWGLSLAYKKYNFEHHKTYILGQSVVKLMRGLLNAMMKQASKVEKFKYSLNPIDALHAKYGTNTGDAVVSDYDWGHLQLDATSLYLLMLTQMSASGLKIIFTIDEVNFVQNLVHYISRTYCTADYGIWERGNKINRGNVEVNSSSVGMAKAALEAIDGFNFFGNVPSQEGIIHVVPSDIARSRFTLYELLPRESVSKETDAALLSIIGFPAFAVEDEELVDKTKEKILKKLSGNYGCKRFLLDGHQSSIEDSSRLHYEAHELKKFENIESEWPLFFTYLLLEAHLKEDANEVSLWKKKLETLFIEEEGEKLLPELYYVPKELIEKEKENPKSQKRVANENIPLVWAQSLYMLSQMLEDKLLNPSDIDPLNRRNRIGHKRVTYPMVAILSENENIKQKLLNYGVNSQTARDLTPLTICHASQLSKVHKQIGKNKKLGLSGRPAWVPRSIATARLHILAGQRVVFLPYYFNPRGFYFSFDSELLASEFRASLNFLSEHWDKAGQPIIPFFVREDMLRGYHKDVVLELLNELQSGKCANVKLKTAPLEQLLVTASIERIDNLHNLVIKDFNIESNIISNTTKDEKLRELNNEYIQATSKHDWKRVRQIANTTKVYDDRLADALLEIVIRHKRLAVGRAYSEDSILAKPIEGTYILDVIEKYCGKNKAERALNQEVILHIGHIIRNQPKLFDNMITIRVWYLIQLMVSLVAKKKNLSIADSYEVLISLSPHKIYDYLVEILKSFTIEVKEMIKQENLKAFGVMNLQSVYSTLVETQSKDVTDWAFWRKEAGMIARVPYELYKGIWYLLQQCKGLVIGDKYNLENRIGHELTLDTTAGEMNFGLRVESLLQKIEYPEYRQLNIELLESLSRLFKHNPQIRVESDLMLDVLIGHAVRINWEKEHKSGNYDEDKAKAWNAFYKLTPKKSDRLFIESFMHLLTVEE